MYYGKSGQTQVYCGSPHAPPDAMHHRVAAVPHAELPASSQARVLCIKIRSRADPSSQTGLEVGSCPKVFLRELLELHVYNITKYKV